VSARGRAAALVAMVLAAAACEDNGPGSLTATVVAPVPTGAVVVELVGARVTGFEGVEDTRAFAADPQVADTVRRVIVITPTGGAIKFRVEVEDVSEQPPRGAVVDAVDPANRKITALTGYQVRISR